MTRQRARKILSAVWSGKRSLTESEWLECKQGGYEDRPGAPTLLAWLQEQAGDDWDCEAHGGAYSAENARHFAALTD